MLIWLLRNFRFMAKIIATPVRRQLLALEAATHRPQEVQQQLLQRILQRQRHTDFGRDHHFSAILTTEHFRAQLPVATYDYFEPYMARVRRGELNALLADQRLHMFALTSGTTATRKYIPVNDQYLKDYKRGWNIWGLKVMRDHPEVRLRPIVQLSGDWQEFHTEAGIPCGAVTGLTAAMQKKIIRWIYCVPGCVGRIKDPAAKYYVALRLSIPRRVGWVIAANPSTLVSMARFGDEDKEALIRDIRDGTLSNHHDIAADIRQELAPRLRRKHPERASELEAIVNRTGHLYPRDYWPKDCIIGNWTGGSVGSYLRHLPTYYGNTPIRDVGLIASEGRMTIPMEDGTSSGILDITSHFYEFIPEDEVNSPKPKTLLAHELEEGETYYILPTTAYGLYRYHIHDVVRVTGFHNKTPLIEFLSKGSYFSNLTGEKISEYHVNLAMTDVLRELDLNLTAYALAPCWDDVQPYYGLFVERGDLQSREQGMQLVEVLERHLQEVNVEYAAKRESLRLGPIRLELVPTGAWQRWDRQRLDRSGGPAEQYKHPCLISDPKFRDSIGVEEELAAV
jgi:hypothetical protein